MKKMYMRHVNLKHNIRCTIVALLCLLCHLVVGAKTTPKDSLLQVLSMTTESRQRAGIYRDLADIHFELPQERPYLKLLISEAQNNNDDKLLLDAYADLTDSYIKTGQTDSARLQLNLIKQMTSNNATQCKQVYLNIRLFNSQLAKGSGISIDALDEELKKQTVGNNQDKSIFFRIEHAYNIASALETNKKYSDALPYINTAVELASTLPFEYGCPLHIATMSLQQRIFQLSGQTTLVVPLIESYIRLREEHYQKYLKNSRPFYPIDGLRISDYTPLIINIRQLSPEKARYYLQKIVELSNKSYRPIDKYRGFLSVNNYHLFKKDYPNALIANDSLIKYAPIVAEYQIPELYNVSSQIYEVMGKYREALQSLKTSYKLRDSLVSAKSSEQLNQLQVQYDLNKLNYEKSQLEVKNKVMMIVSLSIVLLIFVFISIYLYRNLKREKAIKTTLRILKTKAEESERMKTVFINSICHEIRTPLNSIVGFTDLIFDDSVDEQTKQTFPEEIQKNTRQLTGLINSMLEVSNLDVSEQKLPCETTDISAICQREMDRMMEGANKSDIRFNLKLPQTPSLVSTNEQYLSLVVENLLSNAIKFTQSGDITIEYHENTDSGKLQISITDTGCGIPRDKHDEVFERFVKLNAFIPGNGLGLYLCQIIVKRLSGDIMIDPDYTQGTRIVISLPLLEA